MANIWTKEQGRAITERNADILVAAAAGSGKTAVLVERIVRLVCDEENPVDVDKLLVLTFTKAAASQMKERIGKAIAAKMKENPDDEHLKRQITLLNRAQITTIDAFCLRVVRENYMHIDMDPAFRTADEKECDLIKNQVLDDLFEEAYAAENNEDFLGLVESFGEDTGDANLKSLILKLHSFVQSNPFPEQWMEMAAEKFNISANTRIEDTPWGAFIKNDTQFILRQLKEKIETALEIAMGFEGPVNYQSALRADLSDIQLLINWLAQDMMKFSSALMEITFEKLGRKGKGDNETLVQMVKDLREQVKKGIADIQKRYFFSSAPNMVEDVARLYPTATALANVMKRFAFEFKKAKREKILVDYNDMEHYALEVLLEKGSTIDNPVPSAVALNMQKRFFEVLTDEYQDSNLVQEMLLCAISGYGSGQRNRFMVGDVKQSIYRFRQAEPSIFMEKYNTYQEEGKERRIDLYRNFRSRRNILEGINFLFCQLMSPALGDLDYDEKTALYAGAAFPTFDEEEAQKAIEIDIINLKGDESFEDDDAEDMAAAEVEMMFVAKRITELMQSGFKILGDDGAYRNICYRDIVILFRATKNWGNAATEVLEKAGIPVYAQTESKYFANTEISVVLSILKVVDNIRQDIPLMAVLKSPIYQLTDDELVQIKFFGGECEFYDNLLLYLKNEDETAKKLQKFIADIDRWKKTSAFTAVDMLLWTIYSETGYFDYVGVKSNGKIRQANLRLLTEKAEMLEKTNFKGLFNFIRYIEKLEETSSDTTEAMLLGENENLVRIMTIHKSKGLEFPVVFVCGLGKQFNQNDLNKSILMHQRLGLGMEYVDYENRVKYNTISKTVMREIIKRENLSEEMRVLYVALTRAKEKLILTGGAKDVDKMAARWSVNFRNKNRLLSVYDLQKNLTYLDWIGAAMVRHRDGEVILDKAGIPSIDNGSGLYHHESHWEVNIVGRKEVVGWINPNPLLDELHEEEAKEEIGVDRQRIMKYLTFLYPQANLTTLPANVSVSEIKRNHTPVVEGVVEMHPLQADYRRPKQLMEEKVLSGAQKGIAVHTLMAHLNLRKVYTLEEISQEIEVLKNKNLLTPQEAQGINKEKILKFVNSTIGRRIRKADEIYKEESFAMELSPYEIYGKNDYKTADEGILIHGIIDCFFIEGGNAILYDYKTDYVADGTGQELIEKYSIQLKIYKNAIERIFGKKVVETFIYSFYLDKVLVASN